MSKTQSTVHTPPPPNPEPGTRNPKLRTPSPLLWFVVILASMGLYAFALWFGELNQDEGWYLYAGRLVSEGQHPFVDFASTQGPVMAYVYALAQPLVRLWGVAGGRLFTAILGIATALCAALLTHRISKNRWMLDVENPPSASSATSCSTPAEHISPTSPNSEIGLPAEALAKAGTPNPISLFPFQISKFTPLLVFSLLGLNLYHVYFTTMVKTYSLAGLLVVLGFLALEKALRPSQSTPHLPPSPNSEPQTPNPEPYLPLSAFLPAFISAAIFALAAGVRLSAGILLPTIWLVLLSQWLRGGRPRQGLAVLAGFLLGGSVVLLAIYVPFMIAAPQALAFGLLDYHSGRTVGALPTLLVYKAGFLIRLAGAYFPLLALLVGCACIPDSFRGWMLEVGSWKFLSSRAHQPPSSFHLPPSHAPFPISHFPISHFPISNLLTASLIMVTLVHLAAVFPYDDYQVFIMPLLAVVIGYRLSVIRYQVSNGSTPAEPTSHLPPPTSHPSQSTVHRPPASLSNFKFQISVFCFILLAHSASSPLIQNWLLAKRDRIWWPLRTETSLQTLQGAANQVRNAELGLLHSPLSTVHPLQPTSHSPQPISQLPLSAFPFQLSDLLLTQDTYLAVEAGMHVPLGMELGPFCYFPEMQRDKAESCHVLNRAMLRELITTSDAPVAAFSGYGFAIQSPEITQLPVDEQSELWRMVKSRYEQFGIFPTFGQADTELRVLRKK